jgi:hypothetical protein
MPGGTNLRRPALILALFVKMRNLAILPFRAKLNA